MDAAKLKNILFDLSHDDDGEIETMIQLLTDKISTNSADNIESDIKDIESLFSESISNLYTPSNLKILEIIGGFNYVGNSGFAKFRSILESNQYNTPKLVENLKAFLSDRSVFLKLVEATDKNLKKLNIEAHYHNDDTFEVGILMPKEVTDNKINNVTRELNKWDKVIKTIKEVTGGSVEDTKISFINNGSLEFFIDNSPEVAVCLSVIVERVIKIYKDVLQIRTAKNKLKELNSIPDLDQKTIDKQEKDFYSREVEKLSLEIIRDYSTKQIDAGRANELKIAMKGHISYVAKCIDNGIIIEINPPEIPEPESEKDSDTPEEVEKKKTLKLNYETVSKQIDLVDKSMALVKDIGKTGIDIMKYLTEAEESVPGDNEQQKDE